MQPKPESRRRKPKLNRRQRRRLRATPKYREIRELLGTSDDQTMLLLRVGDLHTAEVGESISGKSLSRSHVVIGLSARLKVGAFTEVTAPWLAGHEDHGAKMTISEPGAVMFIDRRHLLLVEGFLAGKVEPVAPIAQAIGRRPMSQPMPRPKLHLVSASAVRQVQC